MRTSALAVTAGIAVAALALAACGQTPGSAPGAAASPASKPESITYWSMWNADEAQQKVLARAIQDWSAQTGIKVNVEWQGRQMLQSLTPALNTNNVPDIADSPYARLAPIFAETGQASDLSGAYDTEVGGQKVSAILGENNMVEGRTVVGGKPWMLPYAMSSDAVWFDKAKYPELATNPPKTWDDFVRVLDRFKADGVTPLAQDGDIGGYNAAWFTTLYVREVGPGKLHELLADKTGAGWDAPVALELAQRVEKLVKGGYFIDGYGASKFPAQQQAWANHKAALLLNGSWIPAETAPYVASGFQFGSFGLPSNSPKKYARADYIGYVVPERAANKYWAGQFAAFVLDKKYQDAYGTEAKSLPIRSDSTTVPEMQGVVDSIREADGLYAQLDGVIFPAFTDTVLFPINNEFVLGRLTAEQYVATMKQAQIDYWKNQ